MRETVATEEEIPADDDWDQVAQTPHSALVVNGALGEYRGQDPDDEKDAPANTDNIFHERSGSVCSLGIDVPAKIIDNSCPNLQNAWFGGFQQLNLTKLSYAKTKEPPLLIRGRCRAFARVHRIAFAREG